MYRIDAGTNANPEGAPEQSERAREQTLDLLCTLTAAENGNFDAQTHAQNIAYVEKIVIGGLRTYYALTSPPGPKAKEKHYSTLMPRILDIASYVSGNIYEEIAFQTDRQPEQVEKQIFKTISLLADGTFETSQYFRTAYAKRFWKFKVNAYDGILGVIKKTEGHESDVPLPTFETDIAPVVRRRTSRSIQGENEAALTGDSVGHYLRQVGRTPLLSACQEVELSKRIEAGLVAEHALTKFRSQLTEVEVEEMEWLASESVAAKEHFMLANLRLVVSIARKYRARESMTMADYIQEGNQGLAHAIKKFDYTRGYKFSTYASPWIKQAITRAISNQADTVRKPAHVNEELRALTLAERRLQYNYTAITHEELAKEMDCEVERVRNLLEWRRPTVSLDAPVNGSDRFDEGTSLIDLLAEKGVEDASSQVITMESQSILLGLIDRLDARSADIVTSRYGIRSGRSEKLADIGKRYGISAERVRQLEREALTKLRRSATAELVG